MGPDMPVSLQPAGPAAQLTAGHRLMPGGRPGGVTGQAGATGVWSSVTQSSRFSGHSRLISRGYAVDR